MKNIWKIRRVKDGLYKGAKANNWDWDEGGHPFMTKAAAKSNFAHSVSYNDKMDKCEIVEFELKEVSSEVIIPKEKK
jgi:hypothetical protein